MSNSQYDAIGVGDEVGVKDQNQNLILGPVKLTVDGQMCVLAFGCMIPFARRNKNRTWVGINNVKVVQHQPALELT